MTPTLVFDLETLPDVAGLPDHAMPDGPAEATAAWASIPAEQQTQINLAYANIGKAIAAFERTIGPQPTRFDAYAAALAAGRQADADALLDERERAGLKLFIGQANCVTCHNGPLFTDNAFHNLALPRTSAASDAGRSASVATVKADPFNCLGPFSDARPQACSELKFMETASADLVGAFRSPSLRGVALRPPYMHAGQFATLHDVLTVLQRSELVTRMAVEIERYIVELGTEGRLIEMQLEETMVGVAADKTALIRDYSVEDSEANLTAVLQALSRMPHQDVLDFGRLAELLGYDRKLNTLDFPVAPRGYRVLGRVPRIPKLVVQKITHELGGLEEVLAAPDAELAAVDGVGPSRAKDIREGLRRLQEVDLVDRYLQS